MTTGNERALPEPEELAQAAGAADPAPAANQPPAEAESTDSDLIEWNAAKAAVKAEETAKGAGEQNDQAAGTDGQQQAPAAAAKDQPQAGKPPAGQQQPADAPMIPKARFDEVVDAKNKAEQNAAYYRGIAEARAPAAPGQPGQPQTQQQQPQPTPEQRLEEVHSQIDTLAKKFDDGDITMVEYKRQERELTGKEQTIREEALLSKGKPAPPAAPSGNDELYLETLTAKLEDEHQWVKPFNAVATEIEWTFISNQARENLTAKNVPLKGAVGSYELRKEISRLIDRLAPGLIADRADAAKAAGFAFPGSQPSQGQQQQKPGQPQPKPLSPEAQARKAALEKAGNAPININALAGSGGDGSGMPTDAALENMSDEEISALPRSTLDRFRGITAA